MKIKKCCKQINNDSVHLCTETEKRMGTFTDLIKGKTYIWRIPEGCWEEEGDHIEIKYCPFCGKKIEVIK